MQMATHERTKAGTPNRQRVEGETPEESHHWDCVDMLRYFANMVEAPVGHQRTMRQNWRRD